MIRFKEKTNLLVVDKFDEETQNIAGERQQTFGAGEVVVDASLCNEDGDFVDVVFADGSRAKGVWRNCFEVVEEET